MDTIKKLSDYAIVKGHGQKFLGVPKTIGYDSALTGPHTSGFPEARQSTQPPTRRSDPMLWAYPTAKTITIMECMEGTMAGSPGLTCPKPGQRTADRFGFISELYIDKFLKKWAIRFRRSRPLSLLLCPEWNQGAGRTVCMPAVRGSDYVDAFRTQAAGRGQRITWQVSRR